MALNAKELSKSFSGRKVVDSLSLSVDRSRVIGLLGPNGAGKTTTFHMIIGFLAADAGDVILDGRVISRLPFYQRARLGISYLPQEPSVFTRASVEDNLEIVLEPVLPPVARRRARAQLLTEFNLEKLRHQRASTLSSGERRRLEIARALARSPRYILLDEPFSGIDPISVADLKAQIRKLREKGIGLLITDHNVRDALSITDYAYLIYEGKLITQGTPAEMVADPLARRFYLGDEFQA